MLRRKPGLKRLARALFAMGFVMIMLIMTAFAAGAVPAAPDADAVATLEDFEELPAQPGTALNFDETSPSHDTEVPMDEGSVESPSTEIPTGGIAPDAGLEIPEAGLGIESLDMNSLVMPPGEGMGMMGEPVINVPHLKWEVKQDGAHVGGATVDVRGPRYSIFGTWRYNASVTDCVIEVGECVDTLDKDPRPGYFAITQLSPGNSASNVEHRSLYAIRPSTTGAPAGQEWRTSTSWIEIPSFLGIVFSYTWSNSTMGYQFPDLDVRNLPSLKWRVTNGGSLIGGAAVTLEGPSAGRSDWANTVQVQDCTLAPCAPNAMDQDPVPGAFSVSTLRWGSIDGFKEESVSRSGRYRIKPYASPVGYSWVDATSIREMTSVGAWGTQDSYDFGAFDLKQAAILSWAVSDAANVPVGGSTVYLRRETNGTSAIYYVTDCTVAPCHPESMDQDPIPGSFRVDTLRGLTRDGLTQTTQEVTTAGTYNLQPFGSIPGFSWDTPLGRDRSITPNRSSISLKVHTRGNKSGQCEAPNTYFTLHRPADDAAQIRKVAYSSDERQILGTSTNVNPTSFSLLGDQTSNALGVTPTGIFYFTGQYRSVPQTDAQIALARNATVYRFDPSDGQPYPVFNMDLLSPTTGTIVAGDATIYQGREEYYFAYFSDKPSVSPLRGTGVRFHLYRYSHGNGERTGEVTHVDVPRPGNLTQFNGDFAFDAQNNIQFIISQAEAGVVSGSVNSADFQAQPSAHFLSEVPAITGTSNPGSMRGAAINGVAYTSSGHGIIQQGSSHRIVEMPSLETRSNAATFNNTELVDLASCATPATITIQKEIIGGRYESDDQFTLRASRREGRAATQEFASATTTGDQSGIQRAQIGPFAISLIGTFNASEDFVNADKSNYRTSWACYARDGQGNLGAPFATGTKAELTFDLRDGAYPEVRPGADLLCRFTNEVLRDRLQVEKASVPASGAQLEPGAEVRYTLNFDNSTGTSAATVNHIDHLSDAVDDADFINRSGAVVSTPVFTTTGGLDTTWEAVNPQVIIKGSVAPGKKASISYALRVKSNQENAVMRNDETTPTDGYILRNYLTTADATEPPEMCLSDGDSTDICTEHSISAWAVFKDSRPVDGARLHRGGNVHYRLVAEKKTPRTVIDDLVFTDDLTDVFKTAGFAPDAVVPGGALPRGIYFFDEFGHSLEAVENGTFNADVLGDGVTAVPAIGADQMPAPVQDGGKWILRSQPVAVPRNAVRTELWFAVQAGEAMSIPGNWPKNSSDMELTPKMGDEFTNFVTASASTQPTQCGAGTDVDDPAFPEACQITHELQENYFTIRKDAMGSGVDQVNLLQGVEPSMVSDGIYGYDKSGMWNMVGHEFEVRDNVSGAPSDYQSSKLCRTDYNPYDGWNGEFTVPGPAAVFDISEDSAILAAIKQWNNENPDQDSLPLCGLLYAQGDIEDLNNPSNPGGQTGRWRSENLPAGDYWLVETKAPTHQISTDGRKKRPVPGIQLLAEPIPFRVWPDEASPDTSEAPSNYGLGQLDVSYAGTFSDPDWLDRCQPGVNAAERPTACVNPTGYLLLVKDVTTITLPFSGGRLLTAFMAVGATLMALAGIGILWWRRRE